MQSQSDLENTQFEPEVTLADETNFQSIDRTDPDRIRAFTSELDETESRSLASNPFFRIGIGVGAAFVCLLIGFALTSEGDPDSAANRTGPIEESGLTLSLENELPGGAGNASEELAEVQAELALLQQQGELADIDRRDQFNEPMVPASPPSSRFQSSSEQQPEVVTVRATAAPSVTPPPPRVSRAPSPPPTLRSQSATLAPPPIVEDPVDPRELWVRLSTGGVIGTAGAPPGKSQLAELEASQTDESSPRLARSDSNRSRLISLNRSGAVPGLIDVSSSAQTVALGQRLEGEIETSIPWLNTEQRASERYLINLKDPILYETGDVAVPAESKIIVQTGAINTGSGYVELVVIGALVDGEIIDIPSGMITVNGEDGDLLIADRYDGVGGGNLFDVFALGVLSGVGQALDGDSTSIDIFDTGTRVTSTEGDGNVFGSALGGGADAIIQQVTARAENDYNQGRAQEVIFYLDEGTDVEFYIDQEFAL